MGYFAVKGGMDAILNSRDLVEYFRLRSGTTPIDIDQIKGQFRLAIDKVMGEGSCYAPDHAAIALKQAEGDVFEAAFMLRAFRATLNRKYYTGIIDTRNMTIKRRISSTFKEIPGGQILGHTRDYSLRMLVPELAHENSSSTREFLEKYLDRPINNAPLNNDFSRVSDILRSEGLMKESQSPDSKKVVDITQDAVKFPAPRSAVLQMMARSETGGLLAFGYAGMRGHGSAHGSIGELRVGEPKILVTDPLGRKRYIGRITVTECECVTKVSTKKKGAVPFLTLGYGLCLGQNELKAICMGKLDRTLNSSEDKILTQEFVLYHTEGIESMGFTNHFKLPHYVTFQAGLKNLRSAVERSQTRAQKSGRVRPPANRKQEEAVT